MNTPDRISAKPADETAYGMAKLLCSAPAATIVPNTLTITTANQKIQVTYRRTENCKTNAIKNPAPATPAGRTGSNRLVR